MINNLQNKVDIDVNTFGFVSRETNEKGESVIFRCQRDYIYYSLQYYFPDKYNRNFGPQELERSFYGIKLPAWLIWTMFHIGHLPNMLQSEGLQLQINNKTINSWFSLLLALIKPRFVSYETFITEVEKGIQDNIAVGVNIAVKPHSVVDHVVFVYGYDEENLYVFDTLQIPQFPYEKVTGDDRYMMKLAKNDIRKRFGSWSRVWNIVPMHN